MVLVVVMNIVGFVTLMVGAWLLEDPNRPFDVFQIMQRIVGPANAALMLAAIILIASSEPSMAPSESQWSLRRCLRILIVVDTTLYVLVRLSRESPMDPFWPISSTLPGWYLREAIGITLAVGSLVFVRRLAHRIPNPRLGLSTSILLWGKLCCLLVFLIVNASGQYYFARGEAFPVDGTRAVMISTAGAGLALTAITCWLALLVSRYRRSVRRALQAIANETRAFATPGVDK
ncbi:MAG: hypothetical protein GY778_01710 [bacterium]|nr:hypothetical protein [bacterium]